MTFPEISDYIRREYGLADDWHARAVGEWSEQGQSMVKITGYTQPGAGFDAFDMPLTQYREIVGTPLA